MLSDGYQTFNHQKRDAGELKYLFRPNDKTSLTFYMNIVDLWANTPNIKGPTRAQIGLYGDNFLLSNDNIPGTPLYAYNAAFNFYHVQTNFSYFGYHADFGSNWVVDNKLYQYRYWNKQNYQNGTTVSAISGVDKLNGYNKYGDTLTLSNVSRFGVFRTGLWYEWAYTDRYQVPTDPRTWTNTILPNFHEHFITQSLTPYAEYEWRATSRLSITPGIKLNYYNMDLTQYQDNGTVAVGCLGGTLSLPVSNPAATCVGGSQWTKHGARYSAWTPSFDARYRVRRNVSIYGQFAEGTVIPPSSVFDVKNAAVLTLPAPTNVKTVQGGAGIA
jgi:iron complex outermembrane receptor protein